MILTVFCLKNGKTLAVKTEEAFNEESLASDVVKVADEVSGQTVVIRGSEIASFTYVEITDEAVTEADKPIEPKKRPHITTKVKTE